MARVRVLEGDCRQILQTLPAGSVQCCITSPPYFGLRDYGHGDQIGLEETPDAYVAELVAVFREVRRVLRDDGTIWVVIGDSYASGTNAKRTQGSSAVGGWSSSANQIPRNGKLPGIKTKDLIGVPWMLAFGLRADRWYLRSDIVWDKPNPMPESCKDRPTKSHEYMFLLSKSETYFYDHEAIKEPTVTDEGRPPGIVRDRDLGYDSKESVLKKTRPSVKRGGFNGKTNGLPGREAFRAVTSMRNKRDVWRVQTKPYPDAHFATYPPELIEPCVLAGTSPQACEQCGAPWERIVETTTLREVTNADGTWSERPKARGYGLANGSTQMFDRTSGLSASNSHDANSPRAPNCRTIGWKPTCECPNCQGSARCVVLDPFGGAGTTALVCDRLDRDSLLIEVNGEYAEMSRRRVRDDAPLFAEEPMTDELGRPLHEKPATTKTGSTAPIIDPALVPEVTEGTGIDDRKGGTVPSEAPADTKVSPDPRRPA